MFFRLHTRIPAKHQYGMEEDCVFEFGEQCNCVDVNNEKFCRFIHKDDTTKTERILMLIPYEHILYIESVEEGDI